MCVFEGGVRVVRGGTFCGEVVLFDREVVLRGSARTYAHVYTRAVRQALQKDCMLRWLFRATNTVVGKLPFYRLPFYQLPF